MIKIDTNGSGRIGHVIFHATVKNLSNDIQIVGISDLLSTEYLTYTLKYDLVHGRFEDEITVEDGVPIVNGDKICLITKMDPASSKWNETDADIVVESTDFLLTDGTAHRHIQTSTKKVIMSAPSKDPTPMFIYGVNHTSYAGQGVISNASYTTNCLVPIAKILDNKSSVVRGLMTIVHAATATQKVVDGPSEKDWRGGRDILKNIIPSSTGAAGAIGKVLLVLNGKLTGMVPRIPTSDASVVGLTVVLEETVTAEEINVAMKEAFGGESKGTLGCTEDAVVSTNFHGCANTSIYSSKAGISLDSNFAEVVSWYDNEWSYSDKVCETVRVITAK